MKVPCKDCMRRTLGCHSHCTAYREYKNRFKSRDRVENEYLGYVEGAIKRMKGA
ncbi:hypothetical protein [Anaerosalibacter massiliensis]|uniref:hypothetical protein n=1 Tax=Anaerosalibacter massiliensis TaxID=1347392 RepID=UPI00164D357B|nr:hypothetical protein [Anaerosalibacter massiliensis]